MGFSDISRLFSGIVYNSVNIVGRGIGVVKAIAVPLFHGKKGHQFFIGLIRLIMNGGKGMSDLTFEETAMLSRVLGMVLSDGDLVEITHRLNVIISRIEAISHPDLDTVVPIPFLPLEDSDDEQ